MATKQDMIDKITATFEYIEGFVERKQDTIYSGQSRKVYITQVLVLQGEKVVEKGFPFIVFDEGQASEAAFWMSAGDPAPPIPEPTFQDGMMTWLSSKLDVQIGPYIIRHIEGATANNALRRGTANVIVEDGSGTFLRKSAAVWKDATGNWQFRVIS